MKCSGHSSIQLLDNPKFGSHTSRSQIYAPKAQHWMRHTNRTHSSFLWWRRRRRRHHHHLHNRLLLLLLSLVVILILILVLVLLLLLWIKQHHLLPHLCSQTTEPKLELRSSDKRPMKDLLCLCSNTPKRQQAWHQITTPKSHETKSGLPNSAKQKPPRRTEKTLSVPHTLRLLLLLSSFSFWFFFLVFLFLLE